MDKIDICHICSSEESKEYWRGSGLGLGFKEYSLKIPKIKKGFKKKFTKFYKQVIAEASPQIEGWEKAFGLKHVCGAGCDYCCYQSIEIYNFELIPIIKYIKSNKMEYLFKEAVRAANVIDKELPPIPFKNEGENGREVLEFKLKYRSLNMPCIFLKDKKCSIYPVRPVNCSVYFSYGKPELCGQKDIPPVDCNSFAEVEDWMLQNIIYYLEKNINKLPADFDPFGINVLPTAIRNKFV